MLATALQSTDQPLVSVVMPSFNSERHISEAIGSVLAQTYPHLEVLVVDGGSRDSTRALVRHFEKQDPRVRWIANHDDRGPAHARATGITCARGLYIAFLDADDLWLPSKLATQVAHMEQTGVRFTFARYRIISDDGARVGALVPMWRRYDYRTALRHRGIGTLTVMLRRELLTEDVISIWRRAGGEELLWWLLILRKGEAAHRVNVDVARYRNTAGSLSKNQMYTLRSVWRMYRHDLRLPFPTCIASYLSYLVDSALRRVVVRASSAF